ncbi:hypothetical protein H0E87_005480 [Populus deltoides]|uniref:Response regulatory domain-containing protein n=1 Tax=Populus deltoides TaxID=3696 RepID=A0A8T2ZJQ7_POPDE|nr:hypothetical protein H0E87_005480 [Populus deltoides]
MAPEMIPVRRSEDRCRSGIPVLQLRNRISALLVDSDRSSQIAQSSFLRYYGVDTQTASNGLSAFVLASASSSTFDLIIIDISLPVMNGLGLQGINFKIIGMTGCWCEMHEQAILDAGANKAIEKPFFPATLLPILRELDDEL